MFMRGISPVISAVLLFLLVVALTSGLWVWITKIQSSATSAASGEYGQIESQTKSANIAFDHAEFIDNATGNDTVKIYLVKAGRSAVRRSEIILKNETGTKVTKKNIDIEPGEIKEIDFSVYPLDSFCPLGDSLEVTVYVGVIAPIRDYPITCSY